MIAELVRQAPHAGVNWGQVATIAGPVLTVLGGIARGAKRRFDRIDAHLRTQDEHHAQLSDRVARIEGPIIPADRRSKETVR